MLPENRQVWKYGFSVLTWISGLWLLFFTAWRYADLEPYFKQFNAETSLLETIHHYGYPPKTHTLMLGLFLGLTGGGFLAVFGLAGFSFRWLISEFLPYKTVGFFIKKLRKQWLLIPRWEKWLVFSGFILVTGARFYFLSQAKIDPDEVTTYNLFLSRGLPGIGLYYPFPNNHILYSLISYGLKEIFGNPFIGLKLPAFLFATLGTLVFYFGLRSAFTFPVVFGSVFALSFSFYPMLYATLGRGYWLQLLCAGLLALATLKLSQQKNIQYWLVFLLTGIAGFFTIPTFLYPWCAMVIFSGLAFLNQKNWNGIKQLLTICFFYGARHFSFILPGNGS